MNTWVMFDPAPHGWWYIRFVHSKKCVRVHHGKMGPGVPTVQWDAADEPSLKWRFIPVSIDPRAISRDTKLTIMSGLSTYLRVNGGKAVTNAQIATSALTDKPNLEWLIQPVYEQPGCFYISTALNPECVVHQNGATQNNGDGVTLFPQRTQHPNTLVTFEPAPGQNWWYIRFVHSKKGLRVQNGQPGSGIPIVQWDPCDQPDLKWRFHPAEASFTTAFYERKMEEQRKAEEEAARARARAHEQLQEESRKQREALTKGPRDPRTLASHTKVNILSCVGTYMHVHGGQAVQNADITTWELVDQPNLQWVIQSVPGKHGHYLVCSAADPNLVLHQFGNSKNNGDKCTLWHRSANQPNLWVTFEPAGGDWWHIKFAHSGKCAHVHGGARANGTAITQWDAVDQPNLKWRFIPGCSVRACALT